MYHQSHREDNGNPSYQFTTSDFIGQLPRAVIHQEQNSGGSSSGRRLYNVSPEHVASPNGWSSQEKRQTPDVSESLYIEPDYDSSEESEHSKISSGVQKKKRFVNKISNQPESSDSLTKPISRLSGADLVFDKPDYEVKKSELSGKHSSAKIMNENQFQNNSEPPANQTINLTSISRAHSYPGRQSTSSARNRKFEKYIEHDISVDVSKLSGWTNGLDQELEQDCRHEERTAQNRVQSGHMTMKNAREIARVIGLQLDDDNEQERKDAASQNGSIISEVKTQFSHTTRRCWSRQCWSNSFHSHAQRFLKPDGKATHTRTKLQQTPVSPATGLLAWELKHQKARKRIYDYFKETKNRAQIWSKSMKTIEGKYGTGVVSYFIFLRWLLYVNVFIFLSVLILIVLPQACYSPLEKTNFTFPMFEEPTTFVPSSLNTPTSADILLKSAIWDEETYAKCVKNKTDSQVISQMQDFLQGTGWMERTLMFSGEYHNQFESFCSFGDEYNLSMAYVLVTLVYFLVCLVMMVIYTTEGVRETMITSEGHLTKYCNLIFGGWDYCIEGKKNAQRKHDSIIQEIKSNLAEERRRAEVEQWSNIKKTFIYLTRVIVNIAIIGILSAAAYFIAFICKYSLDMLKENEEKTKRDFNDLLNEFLPSLTITAFNIVLPALFTQICKFENYSVAFEVKMTLIRTVFLRLSSIGVLVATLYFQVKDSTNIKATCHCWETYVGQQMYKLVILDFIVTVVIVLLIDLPRMLLVKHCQCKLAQFIGCQEFDIPKHVLDLVYSQTLCWIGTFYSPLLPAVCVLKYIFFFYLKKFTLLVNCVPSKIPYRASRSNTFFMIVLMLSFLLASFPLWYSVANVPPSTACGPFRNYHNMWDPISETVATWPEFLQQTLTFLTSVGFAAPVLIFLCLAIYYYSTVWAANKKMIGVLREQLVVEGTDKQFLLARLAEVARRRHKVEEDQT